MKDLPVGAIDVQLQANSGIPPQSGSGGGKPQRHQNPLGTADHLVCAFCRSGAGHALAMSTCQLNDVQRQDLDWSSL